MSAFWCFPDRVCSVERKFAYTHSWHVSGKCLLCVLSIEILVVLKIAMKKVSRPEHWPTKRWSVHVKGKVASP